MDMKSMMKVVEKYTLKETMTLDDLYSLMTKSLAAELQGKFKLKKGLFGKSIHFNVYMQIQPRVSVKNNVVTCRRIGVNKNISVGGGPSIDIGAMRQRMDAVKDGGVKKAVFGGVEYFICVCDAMREVLKDKM